MDDQGWQQAPRSRGPVPERRHTGVYKRTAPPPPRGAGEVPQRVPSPPALRVRSEAPRRDMRDVAIAVEPSDSAGAGAGSRGEGSPLARPDSPRRARSRCRRVCPRGASRCSLPCPPGSDTRSRQCPRTTDCPWPP